MAAGRTALMLATLSTCPLAAPAAAQVVIRGTVADSTTSQGVDGAYVIVLDSAGHTVGIGATAADGGFTLNVPAPGRYVLRASRIGYDTVMSAPHDVGPAGEAGLILRLSPRPVPLDSITARAEDRVPYLVDAGFYRRRASRIGGIYLTRKDIDQRKAGRTSQLFDGMPGIQVRYIHFNERDPGGGFEPLVPGSSGMLIHGPQICLPSVVLNGTIVRAGGNESDTHLDDMVQPNDIEAIEFHPTPAGLPGRWGGYMSPCGTIVIWSRR